MDPSTNGAYFSNRRESKEIIEGLVAESQIVTLAGRIGMGKSPLLQDLTVHILNGRQWCGREVRKRPVIALDFETPDATYKINIERICKRLKVDLPHVPEELDVSLELEHASVLWKVLTLSLKKKFEWLAARVKEKPDAVIIIDPIQIFANLDTNKSDAVLSVYRALRELMDEYPATVCLLTFNMRKGQTNGRYTPPDLRTDPRGWLEGVSGSSSILSRSDVRLGIERIDEELRVINGVCRGNDLTPVLIRPAGEWPDLAGFERIFHPTVSSSLLTESRRDYLNKLPHSFKYSEVADVLVPHSTLTRLLQDSVRLGLLVLDSQGVYTKR